MIDMLEAHLPRALESPVGADMGLAPGGYAVVTLHRPSNVDEEPGLERLVDVLIEIGRRLPVVFPVHARTRNRLAQFGLDERLRAATPDEPADPRRPMVILCEPLGYLDFLGLMARAKLVITDSGGIQEETTVLGIPCLTLRKNTERPVTITEGTNRLVDPEDVGAITTAAEDVLEGDEGVAAGGVPAPSGLPGSGGVPGSGGTPAAGAAPGESTPPSPHRPQLWDGRAGDRIVQVFAEAAADLPKVKRPE
jgi:UDP-N-acetylglucosamine 2-epimerase (non-hydrolysing)